MVLVHIAPPGRNRNFLRLPRAASAAANSPWAIFDMSLRDQKLMSIKREGKGHQSRPQKLLMRWPCSHASCLGLAGMRTFRAADR